jgi:hypothetical protein
MKRAMTQLQRHLAADPAQRATLLLSVRPSRVAAA